MISCYSHIGDRSIERERERARDREREREIEYLECGLFIADAFYWPFNYLFTLIFSLIFRLSDLSKTRTVYL